MFEVATVKLAPGADPSTGMWSPPGIGRFTATHVSMKLLLQLAYGIDGSQIVNGRPWLGTELYDVAAKPEDGVLLSREELKPRLQNLLHQHFGLVAHLETRPVHGYALTVAKGGPHLTDTKADHFPGYRIDVSPGHMEGLNWSMPTFAKYLTAAAGFTVVDQTGLKGSYDISFTYDPSPNAESAAPPLDMALKQATGLVLRSEQVPQQVLVIDAVQRTPAEN